MEPLRVLVVDDSSLFRRVVGDAVSSEPQLELIGTASNGRIALQRIAQLHPDVVTLDIEMPELDGLATLVEIRKTNQDIAVIMFSSLTEAGASVTIDALLRGADDYATKPVSGGSETLRSELVEKIVAVGHRRRRLRLLAAASVQVAQPEPRTQFFKEFSFGRSLGETPPASHPSGGTDVAREARRAVALAENRPSIVAPAPNEPLAAPRGTRPPTEPSPRGPSVARMRVSTAARERRIPPSVIAIGISTGGPNALAQLFGALKAPLGVPLLIVQHMPPTFTRILADRLTQISGQLVQEGVDGAPVTGSGIWIAPGGWHMVLSRESGKLLLRLNQEPLENSCRPAVDPLFRTVASAVGSSALALVMTGMGQDGLKGAEAIRAAGGQIWAQDEASSVVWGMPGAVAKAGGADRVLPLERIGPELVLATRIASVVQAGGEGLP